MKTALDFQSGLFVHMSIWADEAALALERGISGIYTDNLTPADLEYATG